MAAVAPRAPHPCLSFLKNINSEPSYLPKKIHQSLCLGPSFIIKITVTRSEILHKWIGGWGVSLGFWIALIHHTVTSSLEDGTTASSPSLEVSILSFLTHAKQSCWLVNTPSWGNTCSRECTLTGCQSWVLPGNKYEKLEGLEALLFTWELLLWIVPRDWRLKKNG